MNAPELIILTLIVANMLKNSFLYITANTNQYRLWPHYVQKKVWQGSYNQQHYVVDVVFNVVIMLHKWGKCWGAKYLGLLESIQGQILKFLGLDWSLFLSIILYSVLTLPKIKPFLPEIGRKMFLLGWQDCIFSTKMSNNFHLLIFPCLVSTKGFCF